MFLLLQNPLLLFFGVLSLESLTLVVVAATGGVRDGGAGSNVRDGGGATTSSVNFFSHSLRLATLLLEAFVKGFSFERFLT